ncbi:MAG: cytochrome o ubiquinol oxidase subunit III [Candidatus Saccharibacteria bacterium]
MTTHITTSDSKSNLGFWIYLMTDCILFASLFASFIVLRGNIFDGHVGQGLFNMPSVLLETLLLLTSSFTCGLAVLTARRNKTTAALAMLAVTFLLGAAFLGLELTEFRQFVHEGNGWQASGFLSAFFTLVGTHGLHITIGLLWLALIGWQIITRGLVANVVRRLTLFSLFWHFLDIIWIFIFTIVYLIGAIQ